MTLLNALSVTSSTELESNATTSQVSDMKTSQQIWPQIKNLNFCCEFFNKFFKYDLIFLCSMVGYWWAKPQVYGFTEVVKIEYRSNMELFNLIDF